MNEAQIKKAFVDAIGSLLKIDPKPRKRIQHKGRSIKAKRSTRRNGKKARRR